MVIYSRKTMVSVGDPAPDFTLMANDRTMVTLSESLGNKVVLAFYPAAFTGVCTTEMCTFTNFLGDFENLEFWTTFWISEFSRNFCYVDLYTDRTIPNSSYVYLYMDRTIHI